MTEKIENYCNFICGLSIVRFSKTMYYNELILNYLTNKMVLNWQLIILNSVRIFFFRSKQLLLKDLFLRLK